MRFQIVQLENGTYQILDTYREDKFIGNISINELGKPTISLLNISLTVEDYILLLLEIKELMSIDRFTEININ